MTTLEDLETVVPALLPYRSAGVRPVDWLALQAELGVALPADYRDFCGRYPPLAIGDVLVIRVPRPGEESAFVRGVRNIREEVDAEDGLICWGASNMSDYFFWRPSGPDPDRWPAVVLTGNGDWWDHEGGFLALLAALVDGAEPRLGLPFVPGRVTS